MLSVLCPEGKTSSDVRSVECCQQQVMQRLRREVFPEQLYTTEVYPNKGCRSLRVIIKEADTGPEAALNCRRWVGCNVDVSGSQTESDWWRFTTVTHHLAWT